MRIDSLFFGYGVPDLAVIAFLVIAATVFVHCNLMGRRWFLIFLAVAAAAHLAAMMMFPGADLDPGQFKLFASADVLAGISLVFLIEKLLSLCSATRATVFRLPDAGRDFAFDQVPARATRQAMIPPRVARG